jgi:dsRNA-specific ribonuclease
MGTEPPASTRVPTLPSLDDGDLVLTVFRHRSLGIESHPEYGDNKRLADLGNRLLQLATTLVLYSKKPMLAAEEIMVFSFQS